MATRRKFLGYLGIGAASAPLAAKELADKQISDLVLRGEDAAPLARSPTRRRYWHEENEEERASQVAQALRWVKVHGIPEDMERRYRRDAQYVTALDPDIANKRSWSMAVKINEQRQRNYQNQVNEVLNEGSNKRNRKALEAITGFKWPW